MSRFHRSSSFRWRVQRVGGGAPSELGPDPIPGRLAAVERAAPDRGNRTAPFGVANPSNSHPEALGDKDVATKA